MASTGSGWDRSGRQGLRPAGWAALLLGFVGLIVVGFIWLFNSPGFRVTNEIYSGSKDIVTRTHYTSTSTGDTLTIVVARDVTREEALRLQCETVVPILAREHLPARVVIQHPDNDFRLDGAPCTASP